MATTVYSHAFLVGGFKRKVTLTKKDKNIWKLKKISKNDYESLCSLFYKSHVDAMAEVKSPKEQIIEENKRREEERQKMERQEYEAKKAALDQPFHTIKQKRPRFLRSVKHYICDIQDEMQSIVISGKDKNGQNVTLNDYNLKIKTLHLFLFPLDISFYAIEIDDSDSELNSLTQAHFWLMTVEKLLPETKNELQERLKPIINLIKSKDINDLVGHGNKMKIFQVINIQPEICLTDALLYELSTNTAIGSVEGNEHMTPSESYYKDIIKQNSISAFKQWKALALVDSFTAVCASKKEDFNEWPFNNRYFPYIYLRCLYEKTYCFSRNNLYRLDKKGKNLGKEIAQMEKYYFYQNISYSFLPNMIYTAIAKGLGIKEEREELSKQIKESSGRNKRFVAAFISAFATFTVANTICKMLEKVDLDYSCIIIFLYGLALVGWILYICYLWNHREV